MKTKKIIFSLIALANVIFVPIFDVWGGLFPDDPEDNFIKCIEYLFDGDFDYWVLIFTFGIFIPALFMLIFSFSNGVVAFKVFSGLGAASVIINMIRYINQNEIEDVFSFEDCSVSIGTWIALAVFVIAFFAVGRNNKKAAEVQESSQE